MVLLGVLIFYKILHTETKQKIQSEAEYIVSAVENLQEKNEIAYLGQIADVTESRITLIDTDGTVLFDSVQPAEDLENHLNRPEVTAAMEEGAAYDTRLSETLSTQTYYYAIRLENLQVVRVAYTSKSLYAIAFNLIGPVALIFFIVAGFSMVMARKMTNTIVAPINTIDLQNPNADTIYEELNPLLVRISAYNEERTRNEKMRREFSANVSHELKTPITSISGYAELMMNGMVKQEDVPNFSAKIYNEAARLIHLVNDIIQLSRLDEKKIGIDKELVDLYSIAKEEEENLKLIARKYKVSFLVTGTPTKVKAVPIMMREVISNLCENAMKYNRPNGQVYLNIYQRENHSYLEVRDTGIGIPESDIERIFERFYRVDKSRSKQIGGTGLGLAIVKHVVEYHDGVIHVTSKVGEGTVIQVIF